MKNYTDNQKGVSLIITLFIMIIILAVALFVSVILYSEIKIIRNVGNSMVSFFAADSGIEKVLYYDRQVRPLLAGSQICGDDLPSCPDGQTCNQSLCAKPAKRGLCTMYASSEVNSKSCASDANGGIYCKPVANFNPPKPYTGISDINSDTRGCDPDTCDDCQVSFSTVFDNRTYYTTAEVYPSEDGKSSDFEIESKGVFNGSERQVEILISLPKSEQSITITNACVDPNSRPLGVDVGISADVESTIPNDPIGPVSAVVYDADHNWVANIPTGDFSCSGCEESGGMSGTFTASWSTNTVGVYRVDLIAQDTSCSPDDDCNPVETKSEDIPFCGFQ